MISLSKLMANKYPFRNYTKELRNVSEEYELCCDETAEYGVGEGERDGARAMIRVGAGAARAGAGGATESKQEENNIIVNYIGNAGNNQSVSQSFHNTPALALRKYLPATAGAGATAISDIFDEIVSKTPNTHFGLVDEERKTISIYNPSLLDDIDIIILLKKEGKYALFEYKHSSFVKIKKTWQYTRVEFDGISQPKHTKKQLLDLAKTLQYTQVKTSMKKAEIYDLLYQNYFGFH